MSVRWDHLRPSFIRLRNERGLDSMAYSIGASRASIDRWARGLARPMLVYERRIAAEVERSKSHLGHGGMPRDPRVQ